jgi:glutamate-ammonia-ligase adenylyltransferase
VWLLALEELVEAHGVPRDARGPLRPAVLVGLGKLGGRELTTGSDLDLFVVFARRRTVRDGWGAARRRHTFYSGGRGAHGGHALDGRDRRRHRAFQVDLRLRPGSKGSLGSRRSVAALERVL